MNVTLKLPDDLVKKARHLAIDENTSLSGLVAQLLSSRLSARRTDADSRRSWIDAFSGEVDDGHLERDLPIEDRKLHRDRDFSFEP